MLNQGSVLVFPGILLAVLGVSLAVLTWALRGRRQAIPASCGRCGYNLFGRADDADDCSECGADLTPAGAIRTERKFARRGWALSAAVVALVSAVMLWNHVQYLPWRAWINTTLATSWVQSLAEGDHGSGGNGYRLEWQRREGATPAFLDHLLDVQGDLAVPFDDRWDAVLASADKEDRLTAGQRERYLKQMFSPPVTFKVRSPVRIGDPLFVGVEAPLRGRYGGSGGLKITYAARIGAPAELTDRLWSLGGFRQSASRDIPFKYWGDDSLTPGKHRLHVAIRREIADYSTSQPTSPPFDARSEMMIEVLPRGATLGTPRPNAAAADEVAQAVEVGVFHWHDDRCFANVRLLDAGVDRAFTIYAVIDGEEKPIGIVSAKAGGDGTSNAVYVPVSVERAKAMTSLTIVLIGDGDALKETLDQQDYWPGRIVYPDVPLRPYSEAYERGGVSVQPYRIEATE